MLPYLSIIGILLSIILLYFNARKYSSAIYLGAFFLLVSLYGFNQYAVLYSKSVFLVSIVFLNIGFLSYLIGPMLYLYVRSVLTDNSRLKKWDMVHLIPLLLFLMASLPHMLTPYSFKVEVATAIVNDLSFIGDYQAGFFHGIVPVAVIFLSRPLLVLGYMLWSIGFFIRYLMQRKELSVLSQQNFMTKWLSVLLGFLSVLVISHLLLLIQTFTVEGSKALFTLNILQILSGLGLTGLLISPFFFPAILYGLPRFPGSNATSLEPEVTVMDSLPGNGRKITGNFESKYLQDIEQKAESCMMAVQPYLQQECNLAYFAKLIKVPVHHLAYYFREEKKQSFNDFRNSWRIKHAKNLILAGKANELTLEAIGLLSGFSSRNTFFTAFKKAEGISPGVFAAQWPE